jgi:hypothetical protein
MLWEGVEGDVSGRVKNRNTREMGYKLAFTYPYFGYAVSAGLPVSTSSSYTY